MLKEINIEILTSLQKVILQLSNKEYADPISELSNTSIGKHTRHILDFYTCILQNKKEIISYDNRNRNVLMENDVNYASAYINHLIIEINKSSEDKKLILKQNFNDLKVQIKTSLQRELLYNIEHSIHHLAIIKIGLQIYFPHINLPKNFGIAYSTIAYSETFF